MSILADGKLWPCNVDAPWRDEDDMMRRWLDELGSFDRPDGPRLARFLNQWRRLALRSKSWRQYMGYTRSPACIRHVGAHGFGARWSHE